MTHEMPQLNKQENPEISSYQESGDELVEGHVVTKDEMAAQVALEKSRIHDLRGEINNILETKAEAEPLEQFVPGREIALPSGDVGYVATVEPTGNMLVYKMTEHEGRRVVGIKKVSVGLLSKNNKAWEKITDSEIEKLEQEVGELQERIDLVQGESVPQAIEVEKERSQEAIDAASRESMRVHLAQNNESVLGKDGETQIFMSNEEKTKKAANIPESVKKQDDTKNLETMLEGKKVELQQLQKQYEMQNNPHDSVLRHLYEAEEQLDRNQVAAQTPEQKKVKSDVLVEKIDILLEIAKLHSSSDGSVQQKEPKKSFFAKIFGRK